MLMIFFTYKLVLIGNFGCRRGECAALALLDHTAISPMVMIATVVIVVVMLEIVPWVRAIRTITKSSRSLLTSIANATFLLARRFIFKFYEEKRFKFKIY